MIVLDASAVVEWLLGLPLADEVERRLAATGETRHAPYLLQVEVAQAMRRYVRAGDVAPARGAQALDDLADLDVVLYPHHPLLDAMWRLRDNLTMYDAAYIALALSLDAPLLTLDARVAAAPGHGALIDLVA